jgi:hypothetical protein
MEGWKIGRMEGWKIGRMEGWKIGRLEGWRGRRRGFSSSVPVFQPSILPTFQFST